MIRFQIPKAYLPGFESLLSLQSQQVEQIITFLKKIPVGTGPQTFASLFDEEFKNQPGIGRPLAATLYSLGSFKLNAVKASQREIVEGFTQSFHEQTKNKHSGDELKKFSDILSLFFESNSSLALSFKAFQLLSENESVFRENHIVTDIRLLFKDELNDSNRYGLITHQLKLQAEDSGEQNDYYFSLTIADLHKLQEQITRALEKEKLIRQDYKSSISFITITE